ncbi:hypothetical protein [Priestia megaterium]|uniref:hypothetical protein n=1 Tax=Priestia megaterium TaxID=1404 RepID=UPI000CA14DA2|nr:hypothetical protein [Priestia megaterium]AUO14176.1 hypothetical protein C0569_23675 [Priestia megaterium]RMA95684.1 hypothetical protein DEU44_1853 [Priestia megaterium]
MSKRGDRLDGMTDNELIDDLEGYFSSHDFDDYELEDELKHRGYSKNSSGKYTKGGYDDEDDEDEVENYSASNNNESGKSGCAILTIPLILLAAATIVYFSLLGFGAGIYFSIEFQIPIYMAFAVTFIGIFFSQGASKLANFCFAIATAALISRIFPYFLPEVHSLRVEDFQEWSKITPKSTAYLYTLYYFLAITIIPFICMKTFSKIVRTRNGINRNIHRGM